MQFFFLFLVCKVVVVVVGILEGPRFNICICYIYTNLRRPANCYYLLYHVNVVIHTKNTNSFAFKECDLRFLLLLSYSFLTLFLFSLLFFFCLIMAVFHNYQTTKENKKRKNKQTVGIHQIILLFKSFYLWGNYA